MKYLALAIPLLLTGCATADFQASLNTQAAMFEKFNDAQIAQQKSIQACFEHNPNKSECSILAAGTNATQTLGGRPDAVRSPATNGELITTGVTTLGTALVVGAVAKEVAETRTVTNTQQVSQPTQVIEPRVIEPTVIFTPAQ
jgi:hypothetical protein